MASYFCAGPLTIGISPCPRRAAGVCDNVFRQLQWEETMKSNSQMTIAALGALAIMAAGIATAAAQDVVRVRGSIERVDGAIYVIKARDGAELKVVPADK